MIDEIVAECVFLARIPSVSLFEKPFYNFLKKRFTFRDYKRILNENYIAFLPKGRSCNTVISVHIDRLGIIFNGNDFVYSNYYAYRLRRQKYKPAILFGRRFIGEKVVAYNIDGNIIDRGIVSDCRIRDEDNELVFGINAIAVDKLVKSTPIAYDNEVTVRKDEIEGQLDNVVSVALAYFLLKENSGSAILLATGEEIGRSWPVIYKFLEQQNAPNIVTVDTTSIEGLSDFNSTDIVFRTSDDIAKYNSDLVDQFVQLAERKGLRYFLKSKTAKRSKPKTITEVGRIIKESNNKYRGASVQFPVIRYHTNHETLKIRNLEVLYTFLRDLP